jgi:uncharacterized membrane protein YhhN
MTTEILTPLVVASALLNIRAECAGERRQVYVFKPLTVLLIILIAVQARHETSPLYQPLVVAGLVFSLAGDVFLMLPRDRFVQGLVSFLLAHLHYIAAFVLDGGDAPHAGAAVPLAVYGVVMLRLLWPRLGKLKVPVAVYVAAILSMAWVAANRWLEWGDGGSAAAFAGALLFVASDSALAWGRFRGEFRGSQAFILGTYFAAQWLIAVST